MVKLNITEVPILPKLTFNLSHIKWKPKVDLEINIITLMFTCKNS